WEVDAQLLVQRADVLHRLVRDRRTVPEIDVPRELFFGKELAERGARLLVQAVDVMQLNLVEEELLAGARMRDHGGRHLSNSQAVAGGPLAGHAGLGAHLLDFSAVTRVEEVLPRHVDA